LSDFGCPIDEVGSGKPNSNFVCTLSTVFFRLSNYFIITFFFICILSHCITFDF
jgi:hypothetical protein